MKCDNCGTEITFWMSLKQPTPFRFKCSRCKTKYRVSAPYIKTLTLAIVFMAVVLSVALLARIEQFGIEFVVSALLLLVIGCVLEVLWYIYIMRKGTLSKIDRSATLWEGDGEMKPQMKIGAIYALWFAGGFLLCLAALGVVVISFTGFAISQRDGAAVETYAEQITEGIIAYGFDEDDPLIRRRKILVTTRINELVTNEVVAALFHLDAQDSIEPIDLYLNTSGGHSADTYSIIDAMRCISAPVNVWALGRCYSGGAMILAAGTGRRYASQHSVIAIHLPRVEVSDESFSYAAVYSERDTSFWKEKASLPEEWLLEEERELYYLNPQQALEMGIIDEIVDFNAIGQEIEGSITPPLQP